MKFRSGKTADAARATATRLAASDEPAAPGATDGGASGVTRWPRPARVSYGVPGLKTNTQSLQPPRARPDAAAPSVPVTSGRPMPARRHEAALQQFRRDVDWLHPIAEQERGQPSMPGAVSSTRNLGALLDAVHSFFGVGSSSDALALKLLGAVPPGPPGDEHRYLVPLVAATALRSAGATNAPEAARLLALLKDGAHASPEKFRVERALAATAPGTTVLAHLRGLQDQPEHLRCLREGLNLCSELERKGMSLNDHGSVDAVVQALQATAHVRIDHDIGHANDAPLQLLAKATRHVNEQTRAHAQGEAAPAATAALRSDHAAYVAWKQGGFVESGRGSDFEQAIGRMHKFMTYVERADHGPRTLGALAHDAKSYFGRSVGVGKSPLSPMRHGTLGGDLDRADAEALKLRQALNTALSQAVDHLVDNLRQPTTRAADARDGHNGLLRAAVLDLWRDTGQTEHTVQAIGARAGELLQRAGAPGALPDPAALSKTLSRFTRKVRGDEHEQPAVRADMRTLQALAQARAGGGAALMPPAQRQDLHGLLKELKATGRVGADAVPLFKLSDLKLLLRGEPRPGPTADDAQRVMKAMTQDKGVLFSTHSDGGSGGLGGVATVLRRLSDAVAAPIVYPLVGLVASKSATVSVGNYATGGRLFIGTENAVAGSLGLGVGWSTPPLLDGLASASAVAQASANHVRAHTQGLAITARNDQPGWKGTVPAVIDFLFDQSKLKAGDAQNPRAADAAELWSRFAGAFGDNPHVGISWVDDHANTTALSANAGAIARLRTPSGSAIGPGISVGKASTRSRLERTVGSGGDVPIANSKQLGSVNVSLGVSQTTPFVGAVANRASDAWGVAVPVAGVSADWIGGNSVTTRLGRERDGTLSAKLCSRDIMFTDAKSLIARINRDRTTWEQALVALDETGQTQPHDARERLNTFIQQAASVDTPLALYGQMVELSAAAARTVNALQAQLDTILGHGDLQASSRALAPDERSECHALQYEIQRLLKSESSWQPRALWAAETNVKGSTTGLNAGVRLANQEQAEAFHLTALLVAATPRPT
jgi:hypothetical protein